ncbi:hypothetical protein [Wolbachia endosymbiont (group B) of Chorthippus brunneus]|uniref:hypothetical protein n=1 Tax=Wolbachia endosymbiont (group B) of Chorthippus brunneus TaxID=2953996 RepID=UPI0021F8E2F2|nr:hypothetical protein [Wolbachia endosymbiont (group B) of Chorthippus brunneus]
MAKFEAIKSKYRDEGLWSAAKEVPVQGWDLVKEHKGKTIGISLAVIAVASLTAAYLLSPAYATFVGTVGTKAATLVSPAITAMSAFAVAHPLIASLVVLAAVAALITAPVYAYKNNNKASQIEGVKQGVLNACVREGDNKPKANGDKLEFSDDENVRTKFFETVVSAVGGAKGIL